MKNKTNYNTGYAPAVQQYQQVPQQNYAPTPQQQMPAQGYAAPTQGYAAPTQQVPQQNYAPTPQRQMPAQGYGVPVQQAPTRCYAAPAQQVPQQMPMASNTPAGGYYNNTKQAKQSKIEVQDKITRVFGGQGRVLDARNALVKALPSDYAALHGEGGKSHAPLSGIKLTLCDPSKNPSVTVSAHVPPAMFELWKNIADRNSTTMVVPTAPHLLGVFAALFPQGCPSDTIELPISYDYKYEQKRLNSYHPDANGFCPVTSLTVIRQGYYKGSKRELPWTIKISSFRARYTTDANGKQEYIGSTATDIRQAFIQISDENFYKFAARISSFIRVWEDTMCAQDVMNGSRLRDETFASYHR